MSLKPFLITLISFCAISLTAQKVDIDNYRIWVDYASLPDHKVIPDQRTYSLNVSGKYKFDKQQILDALNLRGWTWVQDRGNVTVDLKVQDFVRGRGSSDKRTVEKKDKDGNVTGKTTYYSYGSTNTGRATLRIYGPKNKYEGLKKKKKKRKKKKKKEKEEEKNPFLQGTEDIGSEDLPEAELVGTYDLSQSYKVDGGEKSSSKEAYSAYSEIANERYSEQLDSYQSDVIKKANAYLNETYGYNRKRDRAKFKRLDSDKHPEYEMFDNATKALKELLGKKRFNESHDEVAGAIAPIVAYFEEVVENYGKDDKHEKRLKAASMYNLAQIHYYLDQPDKVIEIGNEYIRWGHDKKDGEKFVEKAEKLKHKLAFHESAGRYFETDENADEIEALDNDVDN